jgi:hypothetical protein
MIYYKGVYNHVYAYEDGTEAKWINSGLTPIAEADADALRVPTAAQLATQRKAEIISRLAEIDAASVWPLRAIAQGEDVQADHDRLAALDAEAAGLREELAELPQSE